MNTTTPTSTLLTPLQVAERLGVTTGTLAVWRCNGTTQIPYVKIGRVVRYRERDIVAFLDGQTHMHTHLKLAGGAK
ncbi:MAG: helix-turn-helix domain-containing protein [Paraglaciecola sp.]|nr:helix-turn-helix domain-containing protein [Paraglaciecola sp.]